MAMKLFFLQRHGSPKEVLGGKLLLFGIVQILLGFACAIISCAAIDLDRARIAYIETFKVNKTVVEGYAMVGLDAGALVSSAWVIVTGCIPTCLACGSDFSLIRTKVLSMVFSILAASLFVPIMVSQAVVTYLLRGSNEQLPKAMLAIATLELLLGIMSAVYCCCSPWHERRLREKSVEEGVDRKKLEPSSYHPIVDASVNPHQPTQSPE